ncbi:MAG TPA: bifunctional [glutamate--ammonia ligase]-adenylyl-L-tyrosine phosphorylase/[glutamate--ammonia-ligase] adenylyltransferase [Gammaproteobacteria bacterium]|nr:bifunctional [glutamate--ammonia ligase]-adenylyl-L-tyrosine phosphorylase/[glutamate--ammonia-ligase] adenylyltransferase [Gammaproteobacteria bacterium]|tara:strand:- start:379 stop:3234 length:2856 start_codon:yes stop_codon:yes gene_type:complete
MIQPSHPIPEVLRRQTKHLQDRFVEECRARALDLSSQKFEIVEAAWTASPFIAELAVGDPQWFIDEILSGEVLPRPNQYYFGKLADGLAMAEEFEAYALMRRFRNHELARIAWRDIVCGVDVADITRELSNLADACITCGIDWSTRQLEKRFGRPYTTGGAPVSMSIIGMGKLGANELNFSSDIDLIFAFAAAGSTRGGREISNQEFFDKLGQQFIALLNEKTADGFVFRVDTRLRPFGESGPLSSSFDALEHYYQLHGRDWERYALLKARIITGTTLEQDRLRAVLQPFVYRRYLDYGALSAVREMKALLNAEVARRNLDDNVKLGPGGIREVEFIGQTYQLIRGGREPRLQKRGIIPVVKACTELELINRRDARALVKAYYFLRQTEHRLQQVYDHQTHQLPDESTEQQRLAFGMGYLSYSAFIRDLNIHRENVQRCFRELLGPDEATNVERSLAKALWENKERDLSSLKTLGFGDPTMGYEFIERLRNPRFLARLSQEAFKRLNLVMPRLIEMAAERTAHVETLPRLAELIEAIARRSVYLSLLADHPTALCRVIDLYDRSPWIARQITQHPLLLDELLDPQILFAPPDSNELVGQLEVTLAACAPNDIEKIMDALRDFKNQQVLRVAASDMMDQFPVAEVSNQLSFIAAALLHHVLARATQILQEKHGEPHCVVNGVSRKVAFAVIAYGKLGGFELGYGSDLDLVFIHNGSGTKQVTDGSRPIDNNVYFTRLAQRIIHYLVTQTAAGRAYEVDTRLRPSGSSGLLVSSVKAFKEYQQHSAWTWEHQALIRARTIAGATEVAVEFDRIRDETLTQVREPEKLRAEIVEMRERMRSELDRSDADFFDLKQGVGGITDIEFMVQYKVLRWAHDRHELLAFTDNLRLLEVLTRLEFLSAEGGATLHDAYVAYRAEIHQCTLQEVSSLVNDSKFREHRTAVTKLWKNVFETQ